MSGKKYFSQKPGLLITFDDGYLDNYFVAYSFLQTQKIPAVYMVSAGLIGKRIEVDGSLNQYVELNQLKEMIQNNSFIGCHTFSHHRMNMKDSQDTLNHEIVESKRTLEKLLSIPIDAFCWCGGEETTYTKKASDLIKQTGYSLGFMTNSFPITPHSKCFQLDRTNIESNWPVSLVKFQLCGFIDLLYSKKRKRIHELTK